MLSFLRRLFCGGEVNRPQRRYRLELEELEKRQVMSASAYIQGGNLFIMGTAAKNIQILDRVNISGTSYYQVVCNRSVQRFETRLVTAKAYFYGLGGNDYLRNNTGLSSEMYGGAGFDRLYGGAGTDFLDAGSGGEFVRRGSGYSLNAWKPIIGGADLDDVYQGKSSTCWVASAISSAARSHGNFANAITYSKKNTYTVRIYNEGWTTVEVRFNGDVWRADAKFNPKQKGEFWVTLVQRAFLLSRGLSLTKPPGGRPGDALTAFTGRAVLTDCNGFGDEDLDFTRKALADGENVIALTKNHFLSTKALVANHGYVVVGLFNANGHWSVKLRNPWGRNPLDPTTAYLTISWADYTKSMKSYVVTWPW